MRYRKLDENGDIVFGNNLADYIEGKYALAQAIRTKILLFSQEWWENISIGIPMFQSIVGQVKNDKLQMVATILLTNRIEELQEVTSVTNIEVTEGTRSIAFKIDVDSIYGELEVEVDV